MDQKKRMVVVLSGGLDSTTLLALYNAIGTELYAISFDYGQRHSRELASAREVAAYYDVKQHEVVDLTSLLPVLGGSALTREDIEVPEGHYESETMRATVVPNRNAIMLNIAAAWSISLAKSMRLSTGQAPGVAFGAHGGDHAIYPDCRPEFAEAVGAVLQTCDYYKPGLYAPFLELTKAEIVRLGTKLRVPFHLTWSCYKGGIQHCGKCGTCVERKEAFKLAGEADEDGKIWWDPTSYEQDDRPF